MKQTLKDYGMSLGTVPLLCDNESEIKIANNPVQHCRTKHMDICHHFLRDHVANRDIGGEPREARDGCRGEPDHDGRLDHHGPGATGMDPQEAENDP